MNETSIAFRPRGQGPGPKPGSVPGGVASRLRVEGMTCGNCARRVTDVLRAVPGVTHAEVDLDAGTARATWSPGAQASDAALIEALGRAGYPAQVLAAKPSAGNDVEAKVPGSWGAAWTVGLPALVVLGFGDWVLGWGMEPRFQWFSAAVAAVVAWVLGRPFVRGAWNQLRAGGANMDTLVSLGMTAALGYSFPALALGAHGHLFFTESVALLALVGTGHHLERRMSARAGAALRALLTLAPTRARRLTTHDREEEVAVEALALGDRLVLRPGDRVPVDARVLEGRCAVDESMLTGESVPVGRGPGDDVCAGTVVVDGRLVVEARAMGEDTALARIAEMVRRAQATRASVQRMADRVSAVFVPAVVLVAAATALAWGFAPEWMREMHGALSRVLWASHLPATPWATGVYVACAVLVVACPCAMGLATPVALMAGVNAAARRGILVRDAHALETCGRLDTVLFDKTGTLTHGLPAVGARAFFVDGTGLSEADVVRGVATLAAGSSHPLSRALAALTDARESLDDGRETPGAGLRGTWRGRRMMLGSPAWVAGAAADAMGGPLAEAVREIEAGGATPVVLALDERGVAAFGLQDAVRPEARAVVQRLRARGVRVGMVSGDRHEVALAVAREAGIDPAEVRSGVRPEGKVACIEALRREGRVVAFVGDGINDGPALAAADLGMAVARATDVAREAAGVVLLGAPLDGVVDALELAGATLRTIRQNLFWAFFYNAAAVPLAAAGLVSPALCAAAMGLSDLIVVGNALRLARGRQS